MSGGCVHCPHCDAHLEPDIAIVLGPLAVGTLRCPTDDCDYYINLKMIHGGEV